jgi:hypothetical protein
MGAFRRCQRRPPPLEPLDRLGADEREGDEIDVDGLLAPCDGTLGADTELPVPVPVDGLVWEDDPLPELEAGAAASVLPEPEDE